MQVFASGAPVLAVVCLLWALAVPEPVGAQPVPPSITLQPTNQTVPPGCNVGLSIVVSGSGPLTYQWQLNGSNLPMNIITTVAGNGVAGYSGNGGPATNAALNSPYGVAADGLGNLFIADSLNNRIRKVDTNGIITTVAGNGVGGYGGDGGPATSAALNSPYGVAADGLGNIFIGDYRNNRIRKMDTNGIITTVAGKGTTGGYSGDGGPATNAVLYWPWGIAADSLGNLFIADSMNKRIRKVDTNGVITTVAGNSGGGYSGDGGPATSAALNNPSGIAADALGNLFIADSMNKRIRMVDTSGIITTLAGNGGLGYSGDGGPATSALLSYPYGVAADGLGNLFIADQGNNRVRKVDTSGIITTLAGNGTQGYSGDGGPGTSARLYYPRSVAADGLGNLFIAESGGNRVRKVTLWGSPTLTLLNVDPASAGSYTVIVSSPYGSVTSAAAVLRVGFAPAIIVPPRSAAAVAGATAALSVMATGTGPLAYQWYFDGTVLGGATNSALTLSSFDPTNAGAYQVVVTNLYGSATSPLATLTLAIPPAIAAQPSGRAVAAGSNVWLSIAVTGTAPLTYQWQFNGSNLPMSIITTVAGNGTSGYSGDGGPATGARMDRPYGVAADGLGNLFIADTYNNRVRKVDINGIITTVAGNGTQGYLGDGGRATSAWLCLPRGVAADGLGNLFISDYYNDRIRKVDTNGIITTVAGNGTSGYAGDGGPATNAALSEPNDVAADGLGDLFIADWSNNRIRKVDTKGIITTVAGNGTNGYSGDGGPATGAALNNPLGVAADGLGNLFIADSNNDRVRKVDANGIITTVAGNGTNGYSGDGGPATGARMNRPLDVAADGLGNLFIADRANNRIRKVDTSGIITTVAGNGTSGYSGDGGPATGATVYNPFGVAADSLGNLFIANYSNNRIRKVTLWGSPTLALLNVSPASAGSYRVIVSSPYGSVTSAVAVLTVGFAPAIAVSPQSADAVAGATGALSVTATGADPLAYQWYFDGAVLGGATNSALAFSPFDPTNAGTYQVIVTNLYGSATSALATLTVGFPPAITGQPIGQTVLAGSNAGLSVAVSGTGPLTYQWQLNGSNLPVSIITTVAGNGVAGYSGDGGPATDAALFHPYGVAADGRGNLFIADQDNNRIRKVDTNGTIITVAGNGTQGFSGDGGPATGAALSHPYGVAADGWGNLFIADHFNFYIRKVDTNGIIASVAGNGTWAYSGDGGPATSAALANPYGVTADDRGNLFVADTYNNRIRKVDTKGIITTVAGSGISGYSGDGGPATGAALYHPSGVAADGLGNLFIADEYNSRIRKVDTNGVITTVAGNGIGGYSGDGSPATSAALNGPFGVAADGLGNLFIADTSNNRIRRVDTNGIITTVAGNGIGGYSGDGGPATNAALNLPYGVAADSLGNLSIADSGGERVRKVTLRDSPTLALLNVGPASAGTYTVIVSSPYGSVTSAAAVLTVALPPLRASIVPAGASEPVAAVQFQFSGTAGWSYVLQCSTNLCPPSVWLPVITNAADANGNWTFSDTNVAGFGARFFRVMTP